MTILSRFFDITLVLAQSRGLQALCAELFRQQCSFEEGKKQVEQYVKDKGGVISYVDGEMECIINDQSVTIFRPYPDTKHFYYEG